MFDVMIKKIGLIFILLLNTIALFAQENIIDEKIDSLILAIPEVKERAEYIEKQTMGERHLRIWIYQTPKDNKEKYYWVKVGENNDIEFVTHFNFFIYPDNLEIKYFDTVEDSIKNLDDFRKKNKKIIAPIFECYYKISFLNQVQTLKRRIGFDTIMRFDLYGVWQSDTILWDTTFEHYGEISFGIFNDSTFNTPQKLSVTDCSGNLNYEIEWIGIDITGSVFKHFKIPGAFIDLAELKKIINGGNSFCTVYEVKFRNRNEPLELDILLF